MKQVNHKEVQQLQVNSCHFNLFSCTETVVKSKRVLMKSEKPLIATYGLLGIRRSHKQQWQCKLNLRTIGGDENLERKQDKDGWKSRNFKNIKKILENAQNPGKTQCFNFVSFLRDLLSNISRADLLSGDWNKTEIIQHHLYLLSQLRLLKNLEVFWKGREILSTLTHPANTSERPQNPVCTFSLIVKEKIQKNDIPKNFMTPNSQILFDFHG